MAGRQLHRLSALRVAKEVTPGHYADGGGLYMQIEDSGARSWAFRFNVTNTDPLLQQFRDRLASVFMKPSLSPASRRGQEQGHGPGQDTLAERPHLPRHHLQHLVGGHRELATYARDHMRLGVLEDRMRDLDREQLLGL